MSIRAKTPTSLRRFLFIYEDTYNRYPEGWENSFACEHRKNIKARLNFGQMISDGFRDWVSAFGISLFLLSARKGLVEIWSLTCLFHTYFYVEHVEVELKTPTLIWSVKCDAKKCYGCSIWCQFDRRDDADLKKGKIDCNCTVGWQKQLRISEV